MAFKTLKHFRDRGIGKVLSAYDCETNGGNLFHGDLPFMHCFTFENKEQLTIEWEVDPFTRQPLIEIDEMVYIVQLLQDAQRCWIGHNIKFDTRCEEKAIQTILGQDDYESDSPEIKVLQSFDPVEFLRTAQDTHTLSHAIDNRGSHKLKDLCVRYLDIGEDDVEALKSQVEQSRIIGKRYGFKIASPSTRPFDSSSEESNAWWKIDMWVPAALYRHCVREGLDIPDFLIEKQRGKAVYGEDGKPVFKNLCKKYCLRDTERTLLLFVLLRDLVCQENLWDQYMMNQRLLAPTYHQESYGVSIHMDTLLSEQKRYIGLANKYTERAKQLADMKYANLNSTEQVARILANIFGLPITRQTVKGTLTIDKNEMETLHTKYSNALEKFPNNKTVMVVEEIEGKPVPLLYPRKKLEDAIEFMFCVMAAKKCTKAANQDLHGYKKRALGYTLDNETEHYLHSSVNLVGTDTTRISAYDPNLTNVSKGKNAFNAEIKDLDLSLRKIFGPSKGRKWVSIDYSQLQLVIAATVSGEEEVMRVIAEGGDLHEFMHVTLADRLGWDYDREDDGQRTIAKNTNFGYWFGAGEKKINLTTHTTGIYPVLNETFPNAQAQIRKDTRDAEKRGYVEASGYRLYPPPDKPFAATVYKVQGWEGKIAKRAYYDCYEALQTKPNNDCHLILFVHDEFVFDMPEDEPDETIETLAHLMVEAGKTEGINVNVGIKIITTNWQEGKKFITNQ